MITVDLKSLQWIETANLSETNNFKLTDDGTRTHNLSGINQVL